MSRVGEETKIGRMKSASSLCPEQNISKLDKHFIPKPGKIVHKSHTLLLVERLYEEEDDVFTFRRVLRKVLSSSLFDYVMGFIIMFNMCAMVIEIDRSAYEQTDSTATHWTETCSWIMLAIFILELSARIFAFRCQFWLDKWNAFDFLIVLIDTVFSLVGVVAGNLFPVSILRIFRLAKLARVSKVLRVFPELRLLIAGLVSSISAIFWGTVLLVLCLVVWSMAAVLFIHPLNKEIDYGDSCSRCSRAYSSVLQASLTFWQQIVTGDSWGQATIPLLEAHPWTAIFFIPVFLSIGMAVINLILGVVVSVAQSAKEDIEADDLKEFIILQAERHTHLLGLCMQMDTNVYGRITHQDLLKCYEEPGEFRDSLIQLEVSREEVEIVGKIIDDKHKGHASFEEVVKALYAVKSSDTQYMLAYIKHYVTVVKDAIQKTILEQEAKEETKIDAIGKEIGKVEALEFGTWQTLQDHQEFPIVVPEHIETCPAHVETSHNVKSAAKNDEEQAWLNQICDRIAMTQSELGGILTALKRRSEPDDSLTDLKGRCYEPLASASSALIESITDTIAKAESREISDEAACSSLFPCRSASKSMITI